jgi:hypothetical protein
MIKNLENIGFKNNDSQKSEEMVKKNSSCTKNANHPVIKKIKDKGGAIHMNKKGEIAYRLSPNDSFTTTKDYNALNNIFSNFLGMPVDFSAFSKSRNKKDMPVDEPASQIKPEDLIMVVGETFDPYNCEEFIEQEDGTYLRNKFTLSKYLQMKGDEIDFVKFRFERTKTFYFLLHLLNHNHRRVYWLINWLAYFFQELKKAQVAFVLIGIQGTGKNIFFNQIIRPLFGEVNTKTINDKSLNTKYKGALVKNLIFLNLDEISTNTTLSESQKNFIKALITNESATLEKKFENLEEETPLHAQVIITSNEAYALEIEPEDRRFTIFSTGNTLVNTNFLGLGSYEVLSDVLKSELEIFSCYLKAYHVDIQMANTALSTPEKDEMIYQYVMKQEVKAIKQQKILQPKLTKLERNLEEYAYAIKTRNLQFFEVLMFGKYELFQIIHNDFCNGVFRVENLLGVYKALYGNTSIKTNPELLKELQNIDFNLFTISNITIWTKIDNIQMECINLPYYPKNYY